MAGIEEIIIADQYLVMLAVSLFFTSISILALWKKGQNISMIKSAALIITVLCWWISGIFHMGASPTTSPFFALGYLWYAIGTVFLVFTIVDFLQSIRTAHDNKWGDGY